MMQNLSANAIRKPIPPIILFVLLTLAGVLGFLALSWGLVRLCEKVG